MDRPVEANVKADDGGGNAFRESLRTVRETVLNPLFMFGAVFGVVAGLGLCWSVFVLPFQSSLRDREAQLEKWSRLNQQMQELAMQNRELSQTQLREMVAASQDASTRFMEIQRHLHDRELRLQTIPAEMILIPIAVLGVAFGGVVAVLRTLNRRALMTIEQVVHATPTDVIQQIVSRHVTMLRTTSRQSLPEGESHLGTRR